MRTYIGLALQKRDERCTALLELGHLCKDGALGLTMQEEEEDEEQQQ